MSRLKEKYQNQIVKQLREKFAYANPMQVPKMLKIVLNMGLGELAKDKSVLEDAQKELAMISGQKPVLTMAKKSISNFKLREKTPLGVKVTLRGQRMYEFMDRFFNIVSPRILDFRGFKKKFDRRGNYSLGITDQQIFPELELDVVKRTLGMDIVFVTSASNDEECEFLLTELGLPFKK